MKRFDIKAILHNKPIEAEEQRVITETMGKPREVLVIGVKPGKAM